MLHNFSFYPCVEKHLGLLHDFATVNYAVLFIGVEKPFHIRFSYYLDKYKELLCDMEFSFLFSLEIISFSTGTVPTYISTNSE